MFNGVASFNRPLGDWNVSIVINMDAMFLMDRRFFNQPLGDWNVSSVQYMDAMLRGATSFNQPRGDWDVSSVEYMKNFMFNSSGCLGIDGEESCFYNV
jgi:hypothetical protein